MSPNRVVWDSKVKEIILSTNSGQIGVLPNHASLVAVIDIGVMKIRLNGRWSAMALMDGFSKIDNDKIIVLVNNAERDVDINPQKAKETFRIAKADLARAEGKRQAIRLM